MAFWYESCPRINQGRLFICKIDATQELYVHCEECEWTWSDPCQLQPESGRLGIDFEGSAATAGEIFAAGWTRFAIHEDKNVAM
jgi:hypothetical protein